MKGASACAKFLIRKEPLEELLMETIHVCLQSLLAGEGEKLLMSYIEEEFAEKANVLLENMSADTKGFVDAKLRDMGTERRKLQARSESLETAAYDPIDADALLRNGLASLHDLPRLMESASMEDRKEFVRAFVAGVSVVPGDARFDVQMRTLPTVGSLLPANSTCQMVAGARYTPLQIVLQPLNRYLAGLRWAA